MVRSFTQLQLDADAFDEGLYRLIDKATAYAESKKHGADVAKMWRHVASVLSEVRPQVRIFAHPRTRDETIG
jgi:hypothetical protein